MKTIDMCGQKWKIRLTNESGGGFDSSVPEITIGVQYPNMFKTIFLHEILEVIMAERGHRYTSAEDMLFSFSHKEFDNISRDLALTIDRYLNLDSLIAEHVANQKSSMSNRKEKK